MFGVYFGFCPRLQIKGLGFCESVETFHKCGYTIGMKTAISIPDSIFSAAERFARRLHKSRSQLFTEALAEYLLRHSPDEVTKAMNRTLDDIGEEHNEFVNKASSMILEQNEW